MTPFSNAAVASVYRAYPPALRKHMMVLREMVLATAAGIEGVGEIEESLKWGEPAYLTTRSKSGSTIRIDWKPARPTEYAVHFNCQTTLVETFRTLFPNELHFEGNRALLLKIGSPLPRDALRFCITAALTYHLRKRSRPAAA